MDDGRECEGCGGPLIRNRYASQVEPLQMWKRRRFCSNYCRETANGAWRPGVIRWTVEDRGHDTPCWVWSGSLTTEGYGRFKSGKREMVAHRAVYEHEIGALPDDIELHHECPTKACVNPSHVQRMTAGEHCSHHRPWLHRT